MHDCTHTNTWVVHAVRGSRGGWGGGGGGGGWQVCCCVGPVTLSEVKATETQHSCMPATHVSTGKGMYRSTTPPDRHLGTGYNRHKGVLGARSAEHVPWW
jgi:hypothetical protein